MNLPDVPHMEPQIVWGILILVAFVYFAPAIVASYRNHRNLNAVLVVNLFLGWTFAGWVAALIWAVIRTERDDRRSLRTEAQRALDRGDPDALAAAARYREREGGGDR